MAHGDATEQPGNSFRYLYWRLSEKEFQQLCQAILQLRFDRVRCLPVGMADGGVDASVGTDVIFQIKWTSKMLQDPVRWLTNALDNEESKIKRLVAEKGISRYVLMTSVAGTTTGRGTGSIQRLDQELTERSSRLGVDIECWWQSDIDAAVTAAPDAVKWAFPEMLAGSEAIRYLMFGSSSDHHAATMRDTLLRVLRAQQREDSKVKFSQADMDRFDLAEMFVDVHATPVTRFRAPGSAGGGAAPRNASRSAIDQLIDPAEPLTLLIGVPGQGKSTVSQHLCQRYRAAILDARPDETPQGVLIADDQRLPIRIDLRDYAEWLSGGDPFDDDRKTKKRPRPKSLRSLELFIADLCAERSGGRVVTIEEVQGLLERYPTLLVLDGLDEVADPALRSLVVREIEACVARMGSGEQLRRFQVLVTARPNSTGLAEPDRAIFRTLRLDPLDDKLQTEFVMRWADVNDLDGKARRRLHRIFRERTALDHIAQLADNPMQLTILLYLISKKGEAVPVSRTALYSEYMDTLMDREVDREQIDRDDVPKVQEITAFLGWYMQSGVEGNPSAGRMSLDDLALMLYVYFRRIHDLEADPDHLLRAASDRFWALTSKVEGTFEFAVQPVREYFAARYLAHWLGLDLREPPAKAEVLKELLSRAYWLNTARFYAGFASPNELAGLKYGVEDALDGRTNALHCRLASWALVADGVFAGASRVQKDVVKLLADDFAVVLVRGNPESFSPLTAQSGGDHLTEILLAAVESAPSAALASTRISIVRDFTPATREQFTNWWGPHMSYAAGTEDEGTWLALGARFGRPNISTEVVERLALRDVTAQAAALAIGLQPSERSVEDGLLAAVLRGHLSDGVAAPNTEAGALLRAMRPQWFYPRHRTLGSMVPSRHLELEDADNGARTDAWRRLIDRKPQYGALRDAARRGIGRKGTTEQWQNPARELRRLHGPSWLAAEIAIAGASAEDLVPSGTLDPGAPALGEDVDYGTFVMTVSRGPSADWWHEQYDTYPDELSRRTWALALLARASTRVLQAQAKRLDAALTVLSIDDFEATAASSSRLALSGLSRAVPDEILRESPRSDRFELLLAHHRHSKLGNAPLRHLSDDQLLSLATTAPSRWPVVQAIGLRLATGPNETLKAAAQRLGPDHVGWSREGSQVAAQALIEAVLAAPSTFPIEWVTEAERGRSLRYQDQPLAALARGEGWTPRLPKF